MPFDKLPDSAEADRDLLQRVKGFLYQRGYSPHRTLQISVERGVVVVQGRVPTFYLRQIAIECTKRVAGVVRLIDLIEISDSPVQSQATEGPVKNEDCPAVLKRQSIDLLTLMRTAQARLRFLVRNRHSLSSAKG